MKDKIDSKNLVEAHDSNWQAKQKSKEQVGPKGNHLTDWQC